MADFPARDVQRIIKVAGYSQMNCRRFPAFCAWRQAALVEAPDPDGSIGRQPELLRGPPHPPMIMRHLGVRQTQMGEGVIDGIGKSGDAADIGRLADPLAPIG